MVSRIDVIKKADQYTHIPSYTPIKDTYQNFNSAFIRGRDDPEAKECRMEEYNVIPYVYGRASILTKSGFLSALQKGSCPGGWDINTGWGTGHFTSLRKHLVGMDCSDYVMKSWGFSSKVVGGIWYGTVNLPTMCLKIKKDELDKGDILLKKGHVRIFYGWDDSGKTKTTVYEAAGAVDDTQAKRDLLKNRSFKSGDDQGCVGRWTRAWENEYKPYSPFPQFTEPTPTEFPEDPAPIISIKIAGSGNIGDISMSLNNNPVSFSPKSVYDSKRQRQCVQIEWLPNQCLSHGVHYVKVQAKNAIQGKSFVDDRIWNFEIL